MTGEPLAEPSSAAADLEPTEVHATTSVEQPAPPAERFDAVTWGVLAIAAGAFLLRLLGLGIKAMHHDESLHATYSWYFAHAAPLYVHDPLMHGPFQFHAMAATFKIFGESDFTARIPAAMIGTLIVLTPLLLRRWLGGLGTLLAALLLALSPALLYYSRFAREDIHIALWTVLMVIAVWRYRDDGRDRWLVLLAAGLALGLATKESVYLTAAVLLLYLDVTLALALAAQRGGTGTVRLGDALTIAPFAWILAAFWSSIEPAREKWRFTTLPREGDLLIVIGTDRPRRGSLKAEEAVGVVLEEQHPLALGDGEDVLATLRPLRHSGGVVERRDGVDHLDPFAVCARRGDGCVEGGGHEAFSVHGHVHDVALVGAEDSECTDVRRGFDEDNVTRITEDAGHQIQGHLRSGRDDDVIRMRGDAHLAHDIENLLPQGDVTLAGSILQHLRAALSDETRRRLGKDVEWNLRTRCDGEESADFGGGHTARAGGVGVHPGV